MLGGALRVGRLILALSGVLLLSQTADAQTRFMYLRGQTVSPAFEGWWPNDDGTFTLFFGYMNSNWEQEFDIPIGPDNYFMTTEAGRLDDLERDAYDASEADQGQPAHFYPRRNPFLFTVRVPQDFADGTELVWTLTSRGKVHRAYASLAKDYRIDPQVISTEVGGAFGSLSDALRSNIPPEIDVEGQATRTVRVGEPLSLAVVANDPDNLPRRSPRRLPSNTNQLYRPPSSVVVSSGPGLRLSWIVYRGPARDVTFNPIQMKTWTDSRVYGNSPWSPPYIIPEPPPGNRWIADAVFDEPGEYLLRVVASDGSMFSYENLPITVTQ
ncbi:MAG: hypothetical protein MK335_01430 [Gemmatimonadetes bacterium]|jgi:hypothetical protein|nr:hypothetical protein [Gemmatimonadota bacterium]